MEKLTYYWKKLRQNKLAYNLVLIAAIILAMAVTAHFVMQVGTRHGARRIVPDFSGVKLDDAQRTARKYDLELHINDSLFVPAYEGGIVLDQLPEGGVEVKPGRTVYITINSFRQKMVPVPYVAGRSLRQAKNMLEIAGLEIGELIYRADMATNYVLEEYCEGRPVTQNSRIQAEMGSGVTLYVGVEGGFGSTVVPRLVGFPLKEAKGRLWELGLNVGKIDFDEGINLLNQKDARVYVQVPTAERSAALGSRVDLKLTLDEKKLAQHRATAEKQAREEAGRDPEYEAVRGGDFALRERGPHETPELPEDVGHGQHETRHERDFHVQVELPRHGGIDNPEIEVRDVERFGIDAQRESCQTVDPAAERGEAVSGLQQQPVGRETGALGAEKYHVDQEVPGEKCGDGDHDDSGGTAHQMGAQRREMGPEVHLRAFVSGVGFRHIGSLGNSRRATDYLSAGLSPGASAGFGFLFSDE